MPFFKDDKELYTCLGTLFTTVSKDGDMGTKLAAAKLIVRFIYKEPEAQITIDLKNAPENGGHFNVLLGTNALAPDVTMTMKADVGHRFWFGKVDLVQALQRRQIMAVGPIPKILKLLPIIQPTYALYPQILTKLGKSALLLD